MGNSLSDTSTLPDLSFEEYLLDDSPIKKFPTSLYSTGNPVTEEIAKPLKDETLNTPKDQQTIMQKQKISDLSSITAAATSSVHTAETLSIGQKKTNLISTSTPPTPTAPPQQSQPPLTQKIMQTIVGVGATAAATAATTTTTTTPPTTSSGLPVLLNSKIALSKPSTVPQTIVKIATAPKSIQAPTLTATLSSSSPSSSSVTTLATATAKSTTTGTALSTVTAIGGKTALKTSNGQIVYLQKGQQKTIGNVATISGNTISLNTPTTIRLKATTSAAASALKTTPTPTTNISVCQASSSASNATNAKILTTTAATATIGGNKTVIQLIRSADGKLLPLKTTNVAGNKGTLTLSPTLAAQLAGKKLITTSGNQIMIKTATINQNTDAAVTAAAAAAAASSAAEPPVTNTSKTIKIQKIMTPSSSSSSPSPSLSAKITKAVVSAVSTTTLSTTASSTSTTTTATATATITTTSTSTSTTMSQSSTAGGKLLVKGTPQIVVQNSQIVKLSSGSNGNACSSGTNNPTGSLQTLPIPPVKQGMQYLRVFTAAQKDHTMSSQSTAAIDSSHASTATTSAARILNSMPSKFTVVHPTTAGKIILTKSPKTDGNQVSSPISVGKVKTIVTVPTLRSIANVNDSSPSTSGAPVVTSVSLIKSGATTTQQQQSEKLDPSTPKSIISSNNAAGVGSGSGQLLLKPKISEINNEIQRLTAPDGKRYLVMPRSMLRTPASATGTGTSSSRLVSGEQQKQHQHQQQQQQQHQQPNSSLNSQQLQQKQVLGAAQQPKVYSVVKNVPTSAIAANASTEGAMKSFIICKSSPSVKSVQIKRALQSPQQHQQLTQQQQQQQQQQQPHPHPQKRSREDEQKYNIVTTTSTSQQPQGNANSGGGGGGAGNSNTNNSNNNNKFVPIKIKQEPVDSDDLTSLMLSDDAIVRVGVRRKHCNCSKSQCLKLYCDCFANGEFCQDCTCKDCFNNLQYEDERQRAIKSCLERNPSAFKPKITTSSTQNDTRLHNKGCNCKRSGCLKNYCECFEAKIPCSSNCKCVGCRNVEDRPDLDMDPIDPKLLESITNASNATNTIARAVSTSNQSLRRNHDKAFSKKERNSESDNMDENDQHKIGRKRAHLDDEMSGSAALLASPQLGDGDNNNADDDNANANANGNAITDKRNTNFITQEVIDATIQCMISQADECLKNNLSSLQIEKMVLEELGRCLVEIIDFSIRNTDTSFSQN